PWRAQTFADLSQAIRRHGVVGDSGEHRSDAAHGKERREEGGHTMKTQSRLWRPPPALTRGMLPAAPSTPRLLPAAERSFFETRLGQDFSQVRVHTGEAAAAAAAALRARAFATGNDIVFADGRYDPASDKGRRLLAHELVHVAQQRQG